MNFNELFSAAGRPGTYKDIQVVFYDIEKSIIEMIMNYSVVVGCAYNFSNTSIIDALSKKGSKSCIIVDKIEVGSRTRFYKETRNKITPFDFDIGSLPPLFSCVDLEIPKVKNSESLRVFGEQSTPYKQHQKKKPRLHHKFLVFGELDKFNSFTPRAVITGSFNFSQNAISSRENAVIFKNEYIAKSFYDEWAGCFMLSESILKYNKSKMEPEFLTGTFFDDIVELNVRDNKLIEEVAEMVQYIRDHANGAFDKY